MRDLKHVMKFESFVEKHDTDTEINEGLFSYKPKDLKVDLGKVNHEDQAAIDGLFYKVFPKAKIAGGLLKLVNILTLEDKIAILTQASNDKDFGILFGEKGKIVYQPYDKVNWSKPGGHVFGSGN